jgi:hypothetical protein
MVNEFYPGAWDVKNKNAPESIRWCTKCLEREPVFSLPEQIEVSTLKAKGKYLKRTYDISLKEYEQLFIKQHGVCAICHQPPTEEKPFLVVDHDHKTEKVRGLLCNNCNVGIGNLRDSLIIVSAAARYLKSTNPKCKNGNIQAAERPYQKNLDDKENR